MKFTTQPPRETVVCGSVGMKRGFEVKVGEGEGKERGMYLRCRRRLGRILNRSR